MGFFSLFGKKKAQPAKADDQEKARKRSSSSARPLSSSRSNASLQAARRDAQAALATVLKIDAIESEMTTEFSNSTMAGRTDPSAAPPPAKRGAIAPATKQADNAAAKSAIAGQRKSAVRPEPGPAPTLQPLDNGIGTTTAFLLGGNSTVNDVAAPSSEAAAVIEESAIMYANGQRELVQQMLLDAITEDLLGAVTQKAWMMLFDLYQLSGKREAFEQLALAYTNKFETSPPAWRESVPSGEDAARAGSVPQVAFAGMLNAGSARNIERTRKLAQTHRALRLEFNRLTGVDRLGCKLLLALLQALQKSGHQLVLVGSEELAMHIRAVIQVGRRDDGEDCWLLLLEVLRLLNREQEFEEASIDYCVTFEVSPPAFVAPHRSITTAVAEPAVRPAKLEGYQMPPLVEGRIDSLILGIAAYSDEHCPAIIDCSQLVRVDFAAAGRLLTGLQPFCGSGKLIEFHHVNHLVAALFEVIGLHDIVRIVPRKN